MKVRDLTKANIGDTMLVRGQFLGDGPAIHLQGDTSPMWLHPDVEVEIVERPFKPDDDVLWGGDHCTVIALDGDEAWVKRNSDGWRVSVLTSSLSKFQS